jgi:hypothetical protein
MRSFDSIPKKKNKLSLKEKKLRNLILFRKILSKITNEKLIFLKIRET